MNNYFKKICCLLLVLFSMSGCFKRDDLEGVDIYTTVYPIQFVTDFLYGYNSHVSSIYPAEANTNEYSLSKKQIEKYSQGSIFVYNGLTQEKGIARDLLNTNRNLKIIDVSQGLEFNHSTLELWINPSDFLMLAHNIKNGLEEYISNKYIIEEIDKNYEDLKVLISSYDAELDLVPKNADNKDIIIANSSLSFLSKYGFNIVNIDDREGEVPTQTKNKANKLITENTNQFVYLLDTDEENSIVKDLVASGAEVKKLRSMTVLSEDDIKNGVNYKIMMRDNIEDIKEELYENKNSK